jgi:hypothetical protein
MGINEYWQINLVESVRKLFKIFILFYTFRKKMKILILMRKIVRKLLYFAGMN